MSLLGITASANATVLISDDFEGSLGNWTTQGEASLYTYPGSGMNFATKGNGAASVQTGWDEGILTLNKRLLLKSVKASSVTISFNYEWDTTSATRYVCIDYSKDSGDTWSNKEGDISSWGSFTGIRTLGKFSKTLEKEEIGGFTDEFKFRLRGKSGGQPVSAFIDNIEIIGADIIAGPTVKDDIPEPSTLVLVVLALSLTALSRRR